MLNSTDTMKSEYNINNTHTHTHTHTHTPTDKFKCDTACVVIIIQQLF